MKYVRYIAALSAFALSACASGTVKDTLGLSRAAPDEFRVVARPPLSVPPQFVLQPPTVGNVAPNHVPADKKAQSIISGTTPDEAAFAQKKKTVSKSKSVSSAESQFLKNAGADEADPNVREVLVEEKYAAQTKEEEESWWDILSTDPDPKDPLVDAKKEAERIQKNEDEGKPVTEGETPEVKAKDRGVLGRILGD